MLFWLVCALLTVAVTVVTLRPLIVRTAAGVAGADDADLRVYKEQLGEVERDVGRGLLTEQEAEAARIEVSRRILAVQPANAAASSNSSASHFSNMVFYLVGAIVATSSVGLYLLHGSPGYGGRPFAERASKPAIGAPVAELIARVEARLREAPNDGQGWNVLAPVYLKQRRYDDAIRAYRQAIALLGENRARLRGLAEAHLAATNGIVGSEVRDAYHKILAKEPHLIAPRFWLAVGLEQDGDRAGAKAAYEALLKEDGTGGQQLPPALGQLIRERLAAVGGAAPPSNPPATEAGKGPPPPADMARNMTPEQRSAMIEKMVSGLAGRLKQDGGTEAEWQRLIRAYWVLGRRKQAAETLAEAKRKFAAEAGAGAKFDAFARELGMNPG